MGGPGGGGLWNAWFLEGKGTKTRESSTARIRRRWPAGRLFAARVEEGKRDGAMTTTLVLTLIGHDQPGLVRVVAATIAEHGGNWLESRMCRLGGEFAGIVRLEIDPSRADGLAAALRGLSGLRVDVTRGAAAGAVGGTDEGAAPARLAALDLVGSDRPGILREVSGVLAAHGLNVEDLASERVEAPMGGGKLFQLRAVASVPAGVELAKVRADLEKIAADLMVELKLEAKR